MGHFAVASINIGRGGKGVRVLDTARLETADMDKEQLYKFMRGGNKIRNMEIQGGRIKWTQGDESRYPLITDLNAPIVENADNIVILSQYEDENDGKMYVVANYKGDVNKIDEKRLLAYGLRYGLSNCKIVRRGNKRYIASIAGEIDTVDNRVEIHYDPIFDTVYANLPIMGVSKLVIPEYLSNGDRIGEINEIKVTPDIMRHNIKHLVLPESVTKITSGTLSSLPSIKKLECYGDIRTMDLGVLGNKCPNLEGIKLKTIGSGLIKAFYGLRELRKLEIENKPTIIKAGTYGRCINLDIKSMVYEGISKIESMAFEYCNHIESINIPKSVKQISTSAFRGCSNLKRVRIGSNTTTIERCNWNPDEKLLEDAENVELYIPTFYPKSYIEMIAPHVNIVRYSQGDEEAKREKQLKARAIGLKVRSSDVAKNKQEVLAVLSMMTDEKWREAVVDCVKAEIYNGSGGDYTIEESGTFMRIYIYTGGNYPLEKVQQAKVGKNYIYIMYPEVMTVISINRNKLIQDLKDSIARGNKNGKWVYESNYGLNMSLPMGELDIRSSVITQIYEEGDTLIIKVRNGREKRVKL